MEIRKDEPLRLVVRGRILSPDADFKIVYKVSDGGEAERETEIVLTPDSATARPRSSDRRNEQPFVIEANDVDSQSKPEKTYKKLILRIDKANPAWFRRGKLVISNPDGQNASWPLPGLPEITGIDAEGASGTPATEGKPTSPARLKLTVNGINLSPAASFKIGGEKVSETQLPAAGIKVIEADDERAKEFARKLELTFAEPQDSWLAGTHELTIVNPDGLSAKANYDLKGATPSLPPLQPLGDAFATPSEQDVRSDTGLTQ